MTWREDVRYALMSSAILGAIVGIGLTLDSLASGSALELSVGIVVLAAGMSWFVYTSLLGGLRRRPRNASGRRQLQRRSKRAKLE